LFRGPQNNSLEVTVNNYNFLKTKTRSVEFKLIEDELKEIDLQLERAEHALNWNSEGKTHLPRSTSTFFTPKEPAVNLTEDLSV
jgi:hypothetical protein